MAISGNLGAKQERAVLALLSERTIEDAATAAQVGLRTLHRWLKTDAVFIAAYREARATAVSHAISRLQQVSREAVDTLTEVMADRAAPAPARVTAATKILEIAIRGCEIEELKKRLDELERHQEVPPVAGGRPDAPEEEASIVST